MQVQQTKTEKKRKKNIMEYSYQDLLQKMTDMSKLAIPPVVGEEGGNFSSYDRRSSYDAFTDTYSEWGANCDDKGCIRMEGDRLVAFEMEGPGVIWRIWSANPQEGNIRIYTENENSEKMVMPFRKWFERYAMGEGRVEWPANFPNLMPTLSRGRNRFIPIPFNRYCKITLDPDWGAYYHITYTKFPQGTVLPEYSLSLEKEAQIPLALLDRQFQMREKMAVREKMLYGEIFRKEVKCASGEEQLVYESKDASALQYFKLQKSEIKWDELESLELEIWWDQEEEKSVSCSMAAFFGMTKGAENYGSWPVVVTEQKCVAYWYMPFKACRIAVKNKGKKSCEYNLEMQFEKLSEEQAEQMMRFHAKEHGEEFAYLNRERFQKSGDRWPDWPMLLCRGTGRFCGVHFTVDNCFQKPEQQAEEWWYGIAEKKTIDWWWGEGDEKFFVDGEKFPSTFGTGSEDYVGYAWAAEPPHVLFDSAYAVQNEVPIDGNGMTSLNRFHICENIPFQNQFEAFLEKYNDNGWNKDAICEFRVTPFWYLLHDGKQKDYYQENTDK